MTHRTEEFIIGPRAEVRMKPGAPAMTSPPVAEAGYSEVQRMLEVAPRYGLEFVLPQ